MFLGIVKHTKNTKKTIKGLDFY